MKDKLLRLQIMHKRMMDLQHEINGEFHNTPISVSDIKGAWGDDGYNLRIDRVDVQDDDVSILFTVFDGEEEIECVEGLSINQFINNAELLCRVLA